MTPAPAPAPAFLAPTLARVIPGAAIRSTRDWLTADHADVFADWTCAERVLATIGALLAGVGSFQCSELLDALTDPDVVDLALDLLTDTGLGCGA